jgi:hypothetical protein
VNNSWIGGARHLVDTMKMKKSRSAEEVLQSCPPEAQVLADKARRLLLKLLPEAEETVDPTASVLSLRCRLSWHDMHTTLEQVRGEAGVR